VCLFLLYSGRAVFSGKIVRLLGADDTSERDEALQQIAVAGLKLYFMACPLMRGFFILIPTAFLFSILFGIADVWCAFPFMELVTAALGVLLYEAESNKNNKKKDMRRKNHEH
jgi:hypothetical protein